MNGKILYVCQEFTPYTATATPQAELCRLLTQTIQERGFEIRTFMPRYGCVNERRHQLHEVIRLSGMNVIICDNDHQLIIKVASIQPSRLQVYFIDNDDYFTRKATVRDAEGNEFEDNADRAMFFSRGVIETVKKLRWQPNIIHCHGWFSALMPLYVKNAFADDPLLNKAKVVVSLYDDGFKNDWGEAFKDNLIYENKQINNPKVQTIGSDSYENLMKLVIDYADGVVIEQENVAPSLVEYAQNSGKPILVRTSLMEQDQYMDSYQNLYNEILK